MNHRISEVVLIYATKLRRSSSLPKNSTANGGENSIVILDISPVAIVVTD